MYTYKVDRLGNVLESSSSYKNNIFLFYGRNKGQIFLYQTVDGESRIEVTLCIIQFG